MCYESQIKYPIELVSRGAAVVAGVVAVASVFPVVVVVGAAYMAGFR